MLIGGLHRFLFSCTLKIPIQYMLAFFIDCTLNLLVEGHPKTRPNKEQAYAMHHEI
ncbi:hypothetical protein MTR_6g016360 [Medicago truncatula]|uniref:Uncharacterized protein n=1 Tax=Medicago truncatula TaxID=3880 RepID=G7ZV08_MEDTR|nr:hypothetical protein MTR_6g016360 [Medicago truncatula]